MGWLSFFFSGFTTSFQEPLIDVADAVANALNSTTFSQTFTAIRRYADLDAKLESNDLTVDVIPVEKLDTDLETRGSIRTLPACDIVIRKRVSGDADGVSKAETDPLVGLLQEINLWLTARELHHDLGWYSASMTPVVHKHLREWHQYTGILRVTYYVDDDLIPAGLINQ